MLKALRLSLFASLLLVAGSVQAVTLGGLDITKDEAGYSSTKLEVLLPKIVAWAMSFLATIFLIMIIYGGFLWMTGKKSSKDKEISKGRDIILAAVSGLVIVAAAYAITVYVGEFGLSF